jgi:hypothetical protein
MATEVVIGVGDTIIREHDGERFRVSRIRDGLLLMYKLVDGSYCEWELSEVIDSMTRRKARRLESGS